MDARINENLRIALRPILNCYHTVAEIEVEDYISNYHYKVRFLLNKGFGISTTTNHLPDIEIKWNKDGLLLESFTLVSVFFKLNYCTNTKEIRN